VWIQHCDERWERARVGRKGDIARARGSAPKRVGGGGYGEKSVSIRRWSAAAVGEEGG